MNTIVLATDGSPSAEAATTEAIELCADTGRPLRIVVVWRVPVVAGYGYAPTTVVPELSKAEREHAERVGEQAASRAHAAGVTATFELRQGDAADEICLAAGNVGASLIVIGAHGWGALKRALFGSVSTHVLREAPCPVLVVREAARAADRAA